MSCPPEATWAVHADGELPPAEALRLEAHVGACSRCRALVHALREENQLLAAVLEEGAGEPAPGRPRLTLALGAAAALVAAAVGFEALSGWIAGLGRETPAALVDHRRLVVGVLFDAVFYLLREGASMLNSVLSALGLAGLVLLAALLVLSLRKRWAAGAGILAVLLALPGPAAALERRTAKSEHERVVVQVGETVDDSLFAAGDTVTVDGTVTGNLIAAGRTVVVRGTVKGDLLSASQRLELEGVVEGNVFAGAETVVVRGPVGRSVYAFAEEVRIDSAARVEDDVVGMGAEVDVGGRVGRDLFAFCGRTNLRGEVGRHAAARTGRLRVEAPAKIGGDLVVHVKKAEDVHVDQGAVVSGKTETHLEKPRKSRFARPGFYFWRLVWLAAAFVTALVLQRLFPGLFAPRPPDGAALLRALGVGFLVLVAVPVGAVLAAFTLVGLPVGLLVLALWLAGLYVAFLIVAALVGRSLLQRGGGPPPAFAPVLLVGLVALTVAVNLPYLGGVVRLAVILLGLGLAVMQGRRSFTASNPPGTAGA
jgi:anti-sigma factor RsiW/cytoskeletal protein CcmA (bactofilin family)